MKCELCKGKGWVQGQAPDIPTACSACGGKGFVEMTNEEWFDGLSTEEKAKFLFEHGVIVCCFCKRDCVEIDYKTKECKYNVSPSYSYTGIVKWLKEVHE